MMVDLVQAAAVESGPVAEEAEAELGLEEAEAELGLEEAEAELGPVAAVELGPK